MAHCFDLSNYLSRINTVKSGIVEYIDTLTQNQEDNTFEIDTVEPLRLQVNGRRLADEMPEVVVSRADMAEEVLASLYHLNAYSEAGSAFDRNQYTMYIRSFQIGGQQFLVHEPYTKYSSKSTREDIKNMEVRNRFAALELKKRKVFTFCNMPWDAKLEPNLNGYLMQSLLLGMKTIDLINVDKPNIVELNAGNGLVSLFLGSKLPQGNILLHNAPGGREFDNYSRIANFNLIPSIVSRSKDKNLGNVVGSATHLVINDLMGVDQTVLVDILKKSNTLKYVLVSGVLDENNIFTDSNIMEELRNIGYEQSGYCETTYKRNNRTFSSYVLTRV